MVDKNFASVRVYFDITQVTKLSDFNDFRQEHDDFFKRARSHQKSDIVNDEVASAR